MTIPNPDALYFQYLGGGAGAEMAAGLYIGGAVNEWDIHNDNDHYLWSYGNLARGGFCFLNHPIKLAGTLATVMQIPWRLHTGRSDLLVYYDMEDADIRISVRQYDGTLIGSAQTAISSGARGQGTLTFTGVSGTDTEGYVQVELSNAGAVTGSLYMIRVMARRIAQADL